MKTAEEYKAATGVDPVQDDLERVNCEYAGTVGHYDCGWCNTHNKPNFICGCGYKKSKDEIEATRALKKDLGMTHELMTALTTVTKALENGEITMEEIRNHKGGL